MKMETGSDWGETNIRKKAENEWQARRKTNNLPSSQPHESQEVLYELEVHQIELEMQNQELMRSQAEIESARKTLADLYDFAPIGYVTLDYRGTILQINLGGAQLFGQARGELVNRRLGFFLPPESREKFSQYLKRVFDHPEKQSCELLLRQDENLTLWGYITATLSEDGQSCRAALVDITERKQAQEALRKSEEKYRNLFENMQEGFLLFHSQQDLPGKTANNFRCLEANPIAEQLTKLPREQFIGQSFSTITEKINPDLVDLASQVHETRQPAALEFYSKTNAIWVQCHITSPAPGQLLLLLIDVSQQKQLEMERMDQLLQNEIQRRLMDQREQDRLALARDIHDGPIQTLASTLFDLQVIKSIFPEQYLLEKLQGVSQNIKGVIQELRQTMNNLRPSVLSGFGLGKTILSHIDGWQERNPQVQFELELPEDEADIHLPEAISLALYWIFQEAIKNIMTHSGAGNVKVLYQIQENAILLEIQDDGIGIPKDYNSNDYTKAKHFGLVAMQERAAAIGGKLTIDSLPDQGTKIRVSVPFSQ